MGEEGGGGGLLTLDGGGRGPGGGCEEMLWLICGSMPIQWAAGKSLGETQMPGRRPFSLRGLGKKFRGDKRVSAEGGVCHIEGRMCPSIAVGSTYPPPPPPPSRVATAGLAGLGGLWDLVPIPRTTKESVSGIMREPPDGIRVSGATRLLTEGDGRGSESLKSEVMGITCHRQKQWGNPREPKEVVCSVGDTIGGSTVVQGTGRSQRRGREGRGEGRGVTRGITDTRRGGGADGGTGGGAYRVRLPPVSVCRDAARIPVASRLLALSRELRTGSRNPNLTAL